MIKDSLLNERCVSWP